MDNAARASRRVAVVRLEIAIQSLKLRTHVAFAFMPDRVVYLLGAGFSAPLGLPLMNNFLAKAKDLFATSPDDLDYFEDVFIEIDRMSKAKNYFEANLFNIEEILSILEMGDFVGGADANAIDFREFICDVINRTTPKLPDYQPATQSPLYNIFQGSQPGQWRGYGAFTMGILGASFERIGGTDKFALGRDNSASHSYDVVTLNYDRVLETAAEALLKYTMQAGDDRESSFDVFPRDGDQERKEGSVLLAKLHGSAENSSSVIAPTWNKGGKDHIKSAWRHAHSALADANHVRIVGYSLPITDTYIKYLLKSAILSSANLKSLDVLCLDNSKHETKERYRSFIDFPTWRFKSANVTEFLDMVISNSYGRGQMNGFSRAVENAHNNIFIGVD
jgi:hypothetical protein